MRAVRIQEASVADVGCVAIGRRSGRVVAVGSGCDVQLWALGRREPKQKLSGHTAKVTAVAFQTRDEFVVSGAEDGSIKVWDMQFGTAMRTLGGGTAAISALGMDATGTALVSGSEDGTLAIWDTRTRKTPVAAVSVGEHAVRAIRCISAEEVYVGDAGGGVSVWDCSASRVVRWLQRSGPSAITTIEVDAGLVVAGDADGMAVVWRDGDKVWLHAFDGAVGGFGVQPQSLVVAHRAGIECFDVVDGTPADAPASEAASKWTELADVHMTSDRQLLAVERTARGVAFWLSSMQPGARPVARSKPPAVARANSAAVVVAAAMCDDNAPRARHRQSMLPIEQPPIPAPVEATREDASRRKHQRRSIVPQSPTRSESAPAVCAENSQVNVASVATPKDAPLGLRAADFLPVGRGETDEDLPARLAREHGAVLSVLTERLSGLRHVRTSLDTFHNEAGRSAARMTEAKRTALPLLSALKRQQQDGGGDAVVAAEVIHAFVASDPVLTLSVTALLISLIEPALRSPYQPVVHKALKALVALASWTEHHLASGGASERSSSLGKCREAWTATIPNLDNAASSGGHLARIARQLSTTCTSFSW